MENCKTLVYGQYMYKELLPTGLLVADSKGETSDFTYIKNQTVSELYDKEEKIYRQILETGK